MNPILPPVIQIPLFGAISWAVAQLLPIASYQIPGADFVSMMLILTGVLIVIPSLWGFYRAKTTVNPVTPEQATTLVVSGIYRFSRNPMYLGFLLMLTGWALSLQNIVSFIPVILFVIFMTILQIKPEEKALGDLFGDEYTAYTKRVRRWI